MSANKYWHLQCILQECLNNAGKHSEGGKVEVFLQEKNSNLILKVTDDGKGFNLNTKNKLPSKCLGLHGITKRAQELGGRLKLASNGKGTQIIVNIPLEQN